MTALGRFIIPILVMIAGVGFVACTAEDEASVDSGMATAERSASDLKADAKDAWASLRTDGERLVDRVQTRNDTDAKQQLLQSCRDALERLRKAEVDSAGRVDQLCTRIRDTDVNNSSAWTDIKSELQRLNTEMGS